MWAYHWLFAFQKLGFLQSDLTLMMKKLNFLMRVNPILITSKKMIFPVWSMMDLKPHWILVKSQK